MCVCVCVCVCVSQPDCKKKCLDRSLKQLLRAVIPSPHTHIRQQARLSKLQLHDIDHKNLMMVIYLFIRHLHFTLAAPLDREEPLSLSANDLIGLLFPHSDTRRSSVCRDVASLA